MLLKSLQSIACAREVGLMNAVAKTCARQQVSVRAHIFLSAFELEPYLCCTSVVPPPRAARPERGTANVAPYP
eukprot:9886090-Karenia_brevis.AAC.1